jgi:hypothetical protein
VASSKMRGKPTKKVKKPKLGVQEVAGEAAAAEKNRQREARSRIVDAYGRLGIEFKAWPALVRAFYTNPQLQYSSQTSPLPFQAPDFDRLNQSPEDWAKEADGEWEKHKKEFLQGCQSWVEIGVDEEIEATVRARGPGKKGPAKAGSRKRKDNTPMDKRYEWVARYLAREPLKAIAGPDDDASVVGRVVREILQLAGWRKPKPNKPGPTP